MYTFCPDVATSPRPAQMLNFRGAGGRTPTGKVLLRGWAWQFGRRCVI